MSESLPWGWAPAAIGEVCPEGVLQGPPGTELVPYVDIGSIDREVKQIGPLAMVSSPHAPTRARQWLQPGDVLVSMTRPNLNAVALVLRRHRGAVASTGFEVLRPSGVMPEWIFYRVRTEAFVTDVCRGLQGVVYPAIRPRDVRQHRLPIAPLPEQRRIVSALESLLSRLDDAIATLERVQRNLKRYRASVLKAAVEGRLVPTEAALARAEGRDYEPASVLLERILAARRRRWEEAELARMQARGKVPKDDRWKAKYKEPRQADASTLPTLPEGWCWASVDALQWDSGYGTSQRCQRVASGPPVLRIPNVQGDALSLEDLKFATSPDALSAEDALRPGDFLFIRTNGSRSLIGRGGLVSDEFPRDHYFASYLIRLRLACETTTGRWFALAWQSPAVRLQLLKDAASSAGQHNVSLSAAKGYIVPLAPFAEQERILAHIDALTTVARACHGGAAVAVRRCVSLRQAILKWAFEGKLVPQDPNDEPASVLLERIRAAREAAHNDVAARRPRRAKRRRA